MEDGCAYHFPTSKSEPPYQEELTIASSTISFRKKYMAAEIHESQNQLFGDNDSHYESLYEYQSQDQGILP